MNFNWPYKKLDTNSYNLYSEYKGSNKLKYLSYTDGFKKYNPHNNNALDQ